MAATDETALTVAAVVALASLALFAALSCFALVARHRRRRDRARRLFGAALVSAMPLPALLIGYWGLGGTALLLVAGLDRIWPRGEEAWKSGVLDAWARDKAGRGG